MDDTSKRRSSPSVAPHRAAPRQAKSQLDAVVAKVRITNPNRVLIKKPRLTKLDLAEYYAKISDWILPHVIERPLTLVRCPTGPIGSCFYQKHWTSALPQAIGHVAVQEKSARHEYVVIEDVRGLVTLVQNGVIEFHPWPAIASDLENPDRLIFDLDPGPGVAWRNVIQGARDVRAVLNSHGLTSFVRTSGGKGLHVVAPLSGKNTWDKHKQFAKRIAQELVAAAPQHYVATPTKSKRNRKVFIDYLRNQRGATAVASYSTRARPNITVATPLRWDELSSRIRADAFHVRNLVQRLRSQKRDPWDGFFEVRQSLNLD